MTLIDKWKQTVEEALENALPVYADIPQPLLSAMRYSLLAGGKRLRPALLLEACTMCGGDVNVAMPYAVALEMIHTYSLIHDDLPGMDDDDLRRGKPTCHKVYGVGMATLAGDGLLNLAMEKLLQGGHNKLGWEAASIIARAAGPHGMVAGQCMDLDAEGKQLPAYALAELQRLKTGALFRAAMLAGAHLASAGGKREKALAAYGDAMGLAFQITDDILDACGDTQKLGKQTGMDEKRGKTTYVSLFGVEGARKRALEQVNMALCALSCFGDEAGLLRDWVSQLPERMA
nr:polyprenyl synthetase family protein [bacterium]